MKYKNQVHGSSHCFIQKIKPTIKSFRHIYKYQAVIIVPIDYRGVFVLFELFFAKGHTIYWRPFKLPYNLQSLLSFLILEDISIVNNARPKW